MSERPKTHGAPQDALFWKDEILQVMWWFKGEGFGSTITLRDLGRFLDAPQPVLEAALGALVADGRLDVEHAADTPRYRFTTEGAHEGARRFADEFAGMTAQGHGECGPDCPHCAGESRDTCVHCGPQADA